MRFIILSDKKIKKMRALQSIKWKEISILYFERFSRRFKEASNYNDETKHLLFGLRLFFIDSKISGYEKLKNMV